MSFQEKLERADDHLRSLGLSSNTDKTILYKFLRSRGLQIKPPFWEPFFTNVLLKFVEFFFIYFFITYLFSLAQKDAVFMDTFQSAIGLSLGSSFAMSVYYRVVAKKNNLIRWDKI